MTTETPPVQQWALHQWVPLSLKEDEPAWDSLIAMAKTGAERDGYYVIPDSATIVWPELVQFLSDMDRERWENGWRLAVVTVYVFKP